MKNLQSEMKLQPEKTGPAEPLSRIAAVHTWCAGMLPRSAWEEGCCCCYRQRPISWRSPPPPVVEWRPAKYRSAAGGGSGSSAGVNFQPCQRRRPSEANGALCCMVKNTLTATMEIFSRERPKYWCSAIHLSALAVSMLFAPLLFSSFLKYSRAIHSV